MGNNCNCLNTLSEEEKNEGIKIDEPNRIRMPAKPVIGPMESAPKFYVPQKPVPPSCYIIPEASPRHESKSVSGFYYAMSNQALSLNDIEEVSKHNSPSLNDSGMEGGESRRNLNRKKDLKRFKTNKEGFTENILVKDNIHPDNQQETQMILRYLEGEKALHKREEIAKKMWLCETKGETVAVKGEDASCFFIVKSGVLEIEEENNEILELKRGDGFGDMALLYNTPHRRTVKCTKKCQMWAIDRKLFKKVVEESMLNQIDETNAIVNQSKAFRKEVLFIF